MNRLRIGLWLNDLRLSLRDALKRVQPWAAEDVGLDAFAKEVAPRELSVTGRRHLARHLRGAGLALVALRADLGGRRLAESKALDANLTRLREAYELARDLGARRLWLPLGYIPDTAEVGENLAAVAEGTRAALSMAASAGVRPCVPVGSEPPERLAAFLKQHDAGGLAEVDLNPAGLVSRGTEPLKGLEALPERVAMATAADAFRGGGEAPFGKGDVRWGEIVVALSTLSRNEPPSVLAGCTRECDRAEALQTAVEALKKLRVNPIA